METTQEQTPGQRRTEAARAARSATARLRRIQRHVEALQAEGFVVTLTTDQNK